MSASVGHGARSGSPGTRARRTGPCRSPARTRRRPPGRPRPRRPCRWRARRAPPWRSCRSPCSTDDDLPDVRLLARDGGLGGGPARPRSWRRAGLDRVAQLLEREVDGVARGHEGAADPHRHHRLDVGHLEQRRPHLGEVVELGEVRVAHHHPPHDLEVVLGLGVVDLDVAGDAADHAAAHRRDDAVEQRVADHDQQAAEEDDAADDERLERGSRTGCGTRSARSRAGWRTSLSCPHAPGLAMPPPRLAMPPRGVTRSTSLPSASRTTALAWAITSASWVEKMKVVFSVRFSSFIRSRMCSPVTESRFAVGSSASTSWGRVTRARAMATRWRCPPDSSLGRWPACSRRPTRSSSAVTRLARSAPDSLRCKQQRQLDVLEHA